jgi:hypothetical protein
MEATLIVVIVLVVLVVAVVARSWRPGAADGQDRAAAR